MISRLEVYKSDSLNPYDNLATEKELLDTINADTFRLFLWRNENTVVIGRNQNPWAECNCALLEAEGGFVARRLSGGGAVFHDKGNLNFTFICSKENYDLEKNLTVIKKACDFAGIIAEISGRNDILAGGKKFSGNAFFHTGEKSLHHGTLLISSKAQKIERYLTPKQQKLDAKGIKSVKSRVVSLCELNPALNTEIMCEHMIRALESIYGFKAFSLDCDSFKSAENIAFFSSWEHIYGKTPPFSLCLSNRFSWGDLEICLNLSGGKITEIKVFTDSLDFSLSERIESALKGAELDVCVIKRHLEKSLENDLFKDVLSVFLKALGDTSK